MNYKNERIYGIDYIRSIMSVFVVMTHFGVVGTSLISSKTQYVNHIFSLSDLISFHVILLAVPSFILVSNFLFILKTPSFKYLLLRTKRVFILFSFWPIAFILFLYGFPGLTIFIPDTPGTFWIDILSAWDTIYYFFMMLLITFWITYFLSELSNRAIIFFFIISCIIVFLVAPLAKSLLYFPLGARWNPLNFIPYSPAAIFISRHRSQIEKKKYHIIFSMTLLAIIFSIIEWHIDVGSIFFKSEVFAFPPYTRVSLVFASIIVLIVALNPRIRELKIISFMSKHSLALYCLHPFFFKIRLIWLSDQHYIISQYIRMICVILLCYILSIVLKLYLKDEVIR
jgi:hypothetical protein